MTRRNLTRFTALAAAIAFAGACGEGLGLGDGEQVTVSLVQGSGGVLTSPVADGVSASATNDTDPVITQADVGSLNLTLTEIEFLREAANEEDDSEWLSLGVTATTVNLMALPEAGEQPLEIASGMVDPGLYSMVRLFVSDATITFTRDITLGAAITFPANDEEGNPIEYDVFIPSGTETGLKTDFEANVSSDTEVILVFDPSATFLNVTVTGDGQVILAPVFRALPDDGE